MPSKKPSWRRPGRPSTSLTRYHPTCQGHSPLLSFLDSPSSCFSKCLPPYLTPAPPALSLPCSSQAVVASPQLRIELPTLGIHFLPLPPLPIPYPPPHTHACTQTHTHTPQTQAWLKSFLPPSAYRLGGLVDYRGVEEPGGIEGHK